MSEERGTLGLEAALPAILGGSPAFPSGPPDWPGVQLDVEQSILDSLKSGSWGKYDGPHVAQLKQRLAEFHGVEFVEVCCSGTAAVELALRALKLELGDEVILAGYDFKGNFQNVLAVGVRPVLVDVDPNNWNLDLDRLEEAIGATTRAVIVSHLHGGVVSMRRVMEIARERNLSVIEDACQMPGAWIEGKRAGSWGHLGVLSFGGSKLLSSGRGGAILTSDPQLRQRIHLHTLRGNQAYPLSELQAAALLPQVARLDADNVRRAARVHRLNDELATMVGLRLFHNGDIDARPGFYKVGLRYDPASFDGLSRDQFVYAARQEGIALDAGFAPLHTTHARSRFRAGSGLSNAHQAGSSAVVLHHPILLKDESAMLQAAAAIRNVQRFASAIRERISGRRLPTDELGEIQIS